ncbi:hypothetical protein B0O80DRAFT_453741 [Mortierella sp. GBAus27b]|nr:hypothetical protein B0O80DRAFT_453741 [Mortierella sp. GBAus27b]
MHCDENFLSFHYLPSHSTSFALAHKEESGSLARWRWSRTWMNQESKVIIYGYVNALRVQVSTTRITLQSYATLGLSCSVDLSSPGLTQILSSF